VNLVFITFPRWHSRATINKKKFGDLCFISHWLANDCFQCINGGGTTRPRAEGVMELHGNIAVGSSKVWIGIGVGKMRDKERDPSKKRLLIYSTA